MFFSAVGLVLVLGVLLLARARQLEDMTAGWRMALYGALGLFFGGFFADGHVSGIFHWYGKSGHGRHGSTRRREGFAHRQCKGSHHGNQVPLGLPEGKPPWSCSIRRWCIDSSLL